MEWMFLPFRRYAEFSGRSRRKEYWMYTLFYVLVLFALIILGFTLGASAFVSAGTGAVAGLGALGGGILLIGAIALIFVLATIIPSIAVAVRRLHDTDRSGWWYAAPVGLSFVSGMFTGTGLDLVISLATLALSIVLLVFYCQDGTPGPNRFGGDPKGRGGEHLSEVFR